MSKILVNDITHGQFGSIVESCIHPLAAVGKVTRLNSASVWNYAPLGDFDDFIYRTPHRWTMNDATFCVFVVPNSDTDADRGLLYVSTTQMDTYHNLVKNREQEVVYAEQERVNKRYEYILSSLRKGATHVKVSGVNHVITSYDSIQMTARSIETAEFHTYKYGELAGFTNPIEFLVKRMVPIELADGTPAAPAPMQQRNHWQDGTVDAVRHYCAKNKTIRLKKGIFKIVQNNGYAGLVIAPAWDGPHAGERAVSWGILCRELPDGWPNENAVSEEAKQPNYWHDNTLDVVRHYCMRNNKIQLKTGLFHILRHNCIGVILGPTWTSGSIAYTWGDLCTRLPDGWIEEVCSHEEGKIFVEFQERPVIGSPLATGPLLR